MKSRLVELLGIEIPLIQSGMGGIAGPELTAAVSNAGALGILAGHTVPLEDLRQRIHHLRTLTAKPFGVNLLIPDDLRYPAEVSSLPNTLSDALTELHEEKGIAPPALPEPPLADLAEKLELLLEEGVPVVSFGLGNPGNEFIQRCKSKGIKSMAMVSSVEDAVAVEQAGVDIVVAQGSEAGGHRSHFVKPASPQLGAVGSMTLIPAVADAVRVPVVAAGGIADSRGIAAAFMLGAEGVLLGTRFIATQESMAVQAYKQAVMDAGANDTRITDVASGRYARLIENELLRTLEPAERLPFLWQTATLTPLLDHARATNDRDMLALWAGQSVGLIDDLPPAGELVDSLWRGARELLRV